MRYYFVLTVKSWCIDSLGSLVLWSFRTPSQKSRFKKIYIIFPFENICMNSLFVRLAIKQAVWIQADLNFLNDPVVCITNSLHPTLRRCLFCFDGVCWRLATGYQKSSSPFISQEEPRCHEAEKEQF